MNETASDGTLYTPNQHAVASRVGEETVILHLTNGTYYGLDEVGTRVWELLQDGATLEALCATLQDDYDVALETLRTDIGAFIADLAEHGLVDRSTEASHA